MRKNVKSLAPILWFVILAFIITIFVDWGGAGRVRGGQSATIIATVGKEKIPVETYLGTLQQRIEALRQQMPELDQNFIQQLNVPQQVLEQVIQQALLLQVARDMGIQASDFEIRERVKSYPVFQRDGRFVGFDEYQRILNMNRMSAADFEAGLQNDIIIEKVVKVITAGVTVSENELWENYKKTTESTRLEYLIIPEDKMELAQEPTAEALQEYFSSHQDDYQIPEKRSASYVFLKSEDLKSEIQLEDEEIEEYYEANQAQFEEPEAVRASRIFLPIGDKEAAQVAAEMSTIREQLQQGEDFASLAKSVSQDEKADLGGDWGEFEWKRLDPEEQNIIAQLEAGELSEVVELNDGASLLKVTEKRPAVQKSLEEVRDNIQNILLDQKSQEMAEQRIAELEREARRGESLAQAAQELGFPSLDSGLLAEGDTIPEIDSSGSISRALFGLQDLEISTPVYTYSGVGLAQLQTVEPARPATFAEAEDEVKEDMNMERKRQLALEKAQALGAELQVSTFEQVSESHDLEYKTAEEHKREQYLSVVGENSEIDNFAFTAPLNTVSDPLRTANGYVLVRVLDRTEVTREQFQENVDTEREGLLEQKRNRVFASFYSKLRDEKNVRPNYSLFYQINSEVLSYFNR
jgi:peptidyl-prolyl cis-trans isomerase D